MPSRLAFTYGARHRLLGAGIQHPPAQEGPAAVFAGFGHHGAAASESGGAARPVRRMSLVPLGVAEDEK